LNFGKGDKRETSATFEVGVAAVCGSQSRDRGALIYYLLSASLTPVKNAQGGREKEEERGKSSGS